MVCVLLVLVHLNRIFELVTQVSVHIFEIERFILQTRPFNFPLNSAQTRAFSILEESVLLVGQVAPHRNEFRLCDGVDVDAEVSYGDPLLVWYVQQIAPEVFLTLLVNY